MERGDQMRDGGLGVEAALRMREQLKLSDAQVNQLEALRKDIVAQRQNSAREMIDLRSRIAAGSLEREEARKQLQSRREAMRTALTQRHEQLGRILTEEQRDDLRRVQRQHARRMMRGERGPRGIDRGFREPPRNRYRW
jgi:hypothetical protein